jgi:hypothetical protein
MRAEMMQNAHRRPELRVESGGRHGGTAKMARLVCGRRYEAYPLVVASSAIAMPVLGIVWSAIFLVEKLKVKINYKFLTDI